MAEVAVVDPWQARFDRAGRIVPAPLLFAATLLATLSVAGGFGSWERLDRGLALSAAAGVGWAVIALRSRAGAPFPVAAVFVVNAVVSGLLVWVNPWYGVYATTGYILADDLPLRWRRPGFVVGALILAASQTGGYPTDLSGHILAYTLMTAVNVMLVVSMATITQRALEQNQQRGRVIDELAEANRRLEASMVENAGLHAQLLVQAREAGVIEERQRLAGEIHDTLAQGLAGIVAQLEAAEQSRHDPDGWRRHLGQAQALARSSLTEARRSVLALHPEPLERTTLAEALGELARTWPGRTGVTVAVDTTGDPLAAGADAEAALFRVAQEALSNVAKHAGAAAVHVTLTYLDDEVLLDVHDDGSGFGLPAPAGGYGLVSMRERLERVGGSLTVESSPGGGTTVNASVPVGGAPAPDPTPAPGPAPASEPATPPESAGAAAR